MPIRINLKEIFGSDSQSVTVDKLNFNFNKLLELGIGLPGEKGSAGPQGGSGPIGNQGPSGENGNYWFVGTGNPNGQTFTDLKDEDFYIDTDDSSIWQYDESSTTWNLIVDLENVVNNYLATSGSPFIRGLGEVSPDDDRYILFPNRGNTVPDQTTDGLGGSSNNDILFLNNFNEKLSIVDIANFPVSTDDLYNSIQKIYTDFTLGIPGRYHLELGSLYQDTNGTLDNYLSDLKQNLKFRHSVDDLGGSPSYSLTNDYIFSGKISMSKPETLPISEIDYNATFETILPKYNNEGGSPIRGEITHRLGSKEAIGEYFTGSNIDGFSIDAGALSGKIAMGIAIDFENIKLSTQDYLMLETDGNLAGIFLKDPVFQDQGTIKQLGTSGFRDESVISNGSQVSGSAINEDEYATAAIMSAGNSMYVVQGVIPNSGESLNNAGHVGRFLGYNIQDADFPIEVSSQLGSGQTGGFSVGKGGCSSVTPVGAGLCDIDVAGEYIYAVHNQCSNIVQEVPPGGVGTPAYEYTQFQIIRRRSYGAFYNQRFLWSSADFPTIDGAWRIKVKGEKAIIINNFLRDGGESLGSPDASSMNEDASVTILDVTNPSLPVLLDSESRSDSSMLDLAVYENVIAVMSLEFNGVTVGGGKGAPYSATGYSIWIHYYEINPSTGSMTRFGERELVNEVVAIGNANFDDFSTIDKLGCIETDGRSLYAAYKNNLYCLEFDSMTRCDSGGTFPNTIPLKSAYQFSTDTTTKSIRCKTNGDHLYLLNSKGGGQYSADSTNFTKIDIKQEGLQYVIWDQEISDSEATTSSTSFEIVGNNAYFNTHNRTSDVGILKVELDGIESDHAQIASLRSNDLKVMNHLDVGDSAKIHQSLNVGPGGIFVDNGSGISVEGPIKATGDLSADDITAGGDINIDGTFNGGGIQTGTVSSPRSSQISPTTDEAIISSGAFDGYGSNYSSGTLLWQRVGNIVHVKGTITRSGMASSVLSLPHDNCTEITGQASAKGQSYIIVQYSSSSADVNDTNATPAIPGTGEDVNISISYEV